MMVAGILFPWVLCYSAAQNVYKQEIAERDGDFIGKRNNYAKLRHLCA